MNYIPILVMATLIYSECNKKNNDVPQCIEQKIEEIKAQPKANPPIQVNEYEFMGKRTFLFSAPCCDQYNVLYDENCNYICAPSGGFTGKGDEKCPDFSSEARHIKVVWNDER